MRKRPKHETERDETTHYNSYITWRYTCEVVAREDFHFASWRLASNSWQSVHFGVPRSSLPPKPRACPWRTLCMRKLQPLHWIGWGCRWKNPNFAGHLQGFFCRSMQSCLSKGNKSFGHLVTTHLSLSDPSLAESCKKNIACSPFLGTSSAVLQQVSLEELLKLPLAV